MVVVVTAHFQQELKRTRSLRQLRKVSWNENAVVIVMAAAATPPAHENVVKVAVTKENFLELTLPAYESYCSSACGSASLQDHILQSCSPLKRHLNCHQPHH
jgi:NCAIR mutase (PurE)-related protein